MNKSIKSMGIITLSLFLAACIFGDGSLKITQKPAAGGASPARTAASHALPLSTSAPIRTATRTPPGPSPTLTQSAAALPTSTAEQPPAPTQELKIGSRQTSPNDGMMLVYIPAGNFVMGSTDAQYEAAVAQCASEGYVQGICQKQFEPEKPAHKVYLDAFWIDQTEVTNGMYTECVSAGSCQASACQSSAALNGEKQPVLCVDWAMAKIYCEWAGRRLPTEAEWEKGARGSDGRKYPWGIGIDPEKANYDLQIGKTSDVGSYPAGASPYGALDMAGNVSEWVADWLGPYSAATQRNPQGPTTGYFRVLRGGSWADNWWGTRSAFRIGDYPSEKDQSKGFRCAMSATP